MSKFFLQTCQDCVTTAKSRRTTGDGTPIVRGSREARILLKDEVMVWNDETRAAYRAQRRKDESV